MATAIKTKGLTLIEAIRQGIYEEMKRDASVSAGKKISGYETGGAV